MAHIICKIETASGCRYFSDAYMGYHSITIFNGNKQLLRVMGGAYDTYTREDLSELFGYPARAIRSFISYE